ncbi:MAG: HAD-IC family P-type ATPase [Gemmatimonadetes bacterium]|nr:HAD-IC family P-type ATPase [Gemmatimonadota bacterium]
MSARAWHTLTREQAFDALASGPGGLDPAEAARRLAAHGPNALESAPPASILSILVAQLRSVVVLLLAVAALLAMLLDERIEAMAILAVLFVNTLIGFIVELRARRAMEALLGLDVSRATVLRDGEPLEIPARDVVPGDLIVLEAGAAVPADVRVIEAAELRVIEAALTGESVPSEKSADALHDSATPIAERENMLFKATTVAAGHGVGLVVATGMTTEVGRIGRLAGEIRDEKTPLEVRLDALGRRLIWITLAIVAAVVGIGVLRGLDAVRMIETGVALAIAAVPEGLPAVATIALGLGLRRMAHRHALVRRLPAVEALGSATVVCTDKTGTLTAGEMVVTRLWLPGLEVEFTGRGYDPNGGIERDGSRFGATQDQRVMTALRIAALVNRARIEEVDGIWRPYGDPTEAALLVAAAKAGLRRSDLLEQWPEMDVVPFSSDRRWMATSHATPDGEREILLKGDPVRVLDLCGTVLTATGPEPCDHAVRGALMLADEKLAAAGLRVLALALRRVNADDHADSVFAASAPDAGSAAQPPGSFTFIGFIGMIDPPVAGVRDTIGRFQKAGIRTVMITGDQRPTAEAVARDLGLLRTGAITLDGRALIAMDERTLASEARRTAAFSRIGPEDKLRIVSALQEGGDIVAMLGDGINDAAALRKADIGVAMGVRGTDVAKEAADIVLGDDRFETIGAAIEEGRVIFDNIRKFVFYLFSCNFAEVLVLATATVAGLPLPLLPLQILWLNLVTDTFPALSLAFEPADPDVMDRAPRDPAAPILSRRLLQRTGWFAALITIVTMAGFVWTLARGAAADEARTVAFATLALGQILHLGNARSRDVVLAAGRVLANRWALAAVFVTIGLQFAAIHFAPLARTMSLQPLALSQWLMVFGLAAVPAVVGQAGKLLRRRAA